ncbi:MAG: hypothetical protein U0521_27480 [Anaerolineae bacterium]
MISGSVTMMASRVGSYASPVRPGLLVAEDDYQTEPFEPSASKRCDDVRARITT